MDRIGPSSFGVTDLMPYMVREVLLVATLYDSFILEEDGRFADQLESQYLELRLSSPPRLTRASSAKEALEKLGQRHFDLVMTMSRIGDMRPEAFAHEAKILCPHIPVVLLSTDTSEPARIAPHIGPDCIDRVFVWKGDKALLLAVIKSIEDWRNAEHDTRVGLVRVVIVVEDSPVFYSSLLPFLYTVVMEQTKTLLFDGLDNLDRIRRMRARAKIVLATTYEEAASLYEQYSDSVIGIISDVHVPRRGGQDPDAWIGFLAGIRRASPHVPILVQSAEVENRAKAEAMEVGFVDKNSPDMLQEIREFIRANFGFGDFVFCDQEGREVARASTIVQMKNALEHVCSESLRYHADRNHISNWLMARGEFPLAIELRPKSLEDFEDIDAMRDYIVAAFETFLDRQQHGRITEFSREGYHLGRVFARLGGGSLGGKGRGSAFLYRLVARSSLRRRFPDVSIIVPRTTVICTDEFDRFVGSNGLRDRVSEAQTDEEIAGLFLKTRISEEVHQDLAAMLEHVRYPLAIRSSSLLEDSQFQPFAGVYATYILPNNHPSLRVRLRDLRRAIKLVYASTFFSATRAYMRAINRRLEEEKMAVLIQRLVGHDYGPRFYPTVSGVAQSYNYYPLSHMEPSDGIALVALGLGRMVLEGGKALRFSPRHPQILPQMSVPADALRNTQTKFFALNMAAANVRVTRDEENTLVQPSLKEAELDGSLRWVGATYCPQQERIYDTVYRDGVRLVNFAPILKHGQFPLSSLLHEVLELGSTSMGCPVEIEFAVNLEVPGGKRPEFAVLQIRPLVTSNADPIPDLSTVDEDRVFVRSQRALGDGRVTDIYDVVYVRPDRFDVTKTVAMADEVARINAKLVASHRLCLLIGPGRWGTSDRFLGIPVRFTQVAAARVIVEVGLKGFDVDPSQGTHFFHNITSLRVGYLAVDARRESEALDWEWLEKREVVEELEYVRHVRLKAPLDCYLDGKSGQGVILRGSE